MIQNLSIPRNFPRRLNCLWKPLNLGINTYIDFIKFTIRNYLIDKSNGMCVCLCINFPFLPQNVFIYIYFQRGYFYHLERNCPQIKDSRLHKLFLHKVRWLIGTLRDTKKRTEIAKFYVKAISLKMNKNLSKYIDTRNLGPNNVNITNCDSFATLASFTQVCIVYCIYIYIYCQSTHIQKS